MTVFLKSMKSQLIYRSAMLSGAVSSLLTFIIQVSLWYALLGQGVKKDTSLSDILIYLIINSIVLTVTKANISSIIESSVIDGSVTMQLIRPVSYKYFLLSSIMGQNTFKVFANVMPVMIISIFIVDFSLLPSPLYLFIFLISAVIGMLIMFEVTYIVGLLAFWIQRCWFLEWYLNAGLAFFGGTVLPLWFYPHGLNMVSYFLPFRYITFEPVNIFLQKTPIESLWIPIAAGIAWLLILTTIDKVMWNQATNRLSVNGG